MSKLDFDRRTFLLAGACVAALPSAALAAADRFATSPWRKISDAEWKKRLSPESYDVLRHQGTEQPFSSPLLKEHRKGTFACLGCGLPLFKSDWKFESGTGWPSFYTQIPGALGKQSDHGLPFEERTEYHCARCLGHQGHVFNDGPKPTGLRYCNDGVALKFIPA
ncbi:MAG TPA: peptide-methionine (R)-S-oxide reductase MsrB [Phenylobacterium sp.]|jgi:peptide-methionine (R)-S-oxide reductase|nr:peptide-methionine (R)-S-oxide reductase MsrB [Phenylobacterium sp.]